MGLLALLLISAPLILEQPHDARGMPTGPVLANGAPLELPVALERSRCPAAPEDGAIVWRFDEHDRWAVVSTWLLRLAPCGLDQLKLAAPDGTLRSVKLWRKTERPDGLLNIHKPPSRTTERYATLMMGQEITTVDLKRAEHTRALTRMLPAQRVLYFHPKTSLQAIHQRLALLPPTLPDVRVSLKPLHQRNKPLLALLGKRLTPKDIEHLSSLGPPSGALTRAFGYAVAPQKLKVERPDWIHLEDPIACRQKDKAYIWARGKSKGIRTPSLAMSSASNRGRSLVSLFIQTNGKPKPRPRSWVGTLNQVITLDSYTEDQVVFALLQKEAPPKLRALAKSECPSGVTIHEVWKPRPMELDGSPAKTPPAWAQGVPFSLGETIRWTRPAPIGTGSSHAMSAKAAKEELLQALRTASEKAGGACAARAVAWAKLPFHVKSDHFGALGRTMINVSISRTSLANVLEPDCKADWMDQALANVEQEILWKHPELRQGAQDCALTLAKRLFSEDQEAQLGRVYWQKDGREFPMRPLFDFMVDKLPQSSKTLNILDVQLKLTETGGDRFLVMLGEFRGAKHKTPAFSQRCWRVIGPQRGTPQW